MPTIKRRDTNLELYRIIVMIMIMAHHYLFHSGIIDMIQEAPISVSSISMLIFGAWGKVGINCFVMITGYYMCTSSITKRKFIKLYTQVAFYSIIIYSIFCVTGYTQFSFTDFILKIIPVDIVTTNFATCFLLFYLFIPFINVLIQNISKKQHGLLILLLLFIYTLLPSIDITVGYNYISWFITIYLVASYIRLYNIGENYKTSTWGLITIALIIIGSGTIILLYCANKLGYIGSFAPFFFLFDCIKFIPLAIGISSFMWFKRIHIPYSRFINFVASTTFGVLLIHDNSPLMREWLWKGVLNCSDNFYLPTIQQITIATATVLLVFFICSGIEALRIKFVEPYILSVFFKNRQTTIIKDKKTTA